MTETSPLQPPSGRPSSLRYITEPSGVGVGTSSTGMSGGGPHATAAFENAMAKAVVSVSSTTCSGVNSSFSCVLERVGKAGGVVDDDVGVPHARA